MELFEFFLLIIKIQSCRLIVPRYKHYEQLCMMNILLLKFNKIKKSREALKSIILHP